VSHAYDDIMASYCVYVIDYAIVYVILIYLTVTI